MPQASEKFSVVVPVLNAKDHLRACLNSIQGAIEQYGNAELIVLDNGSDDGSYEILLQEYANRARIYQIRGINVSALRNRGAGLAEGDFISFIDSDCLIGSDYFEQALKVLRAGVDATGSEYALEESSHWIQKTWQRIHVPDRDGFVKAITAGNLVIRRAAFVAVGGFDEQMVSCEDDDLGIRLNKAGFKVYQARAVRALHPGGDQSLRVFFRKSAWRSMGMFRMMKHGWVSKPVLITFAHLLLCLAAAAGLFLLPFSLPIRGLLFLLLVNLAPALSVGYRSWTVGTLYAPMRSILLYHVYFLGRFYAMWKMALSLGTSAETKNAISARLHSSPKPGRSELPER
jgi:glycosyltransferase involved in cell wall biosynthesis